jgi:hypothetical protein
MLDDVAPSYLAVSLAESSASTSGSESDVLTISVYSVESIKEENNERAS